MMRDLTGADVALRQMDTLAESVRRAPGSIVLLFFTRAATALADGLHLSAEPEQFMLDWQTEIKAMLAFYRRHRSQTLLLDAERACASPDIVAAGLKRLGYDHASANQATPCLKEQISILEHWLARRLLEGDVTTRLVESELEACALPLPAGEKIDLDDPKTLWARYRVDRRAASKSVETLKSTADTSSSKPPQQVVTAEATETPAKDKQIEALTAEKIDLTEENELLLLQLHQVQEELEALFLQNQELQAKANLSSEPMAKQEGKSAAKSSSNPLIRYLRHGRKEGHRSKR
ncbi:hypothetical protein [Lamprobacter modestohalophilus]|nr:hypothetical protein [Lamprobacter modestohalophilus]